MSQQFARKPSTPSTSTSTRQLALCPQSRGSAVHVRASVPAPTLCNIVEHHSISGTLHVITWCGHLVRLWPLPRRIVQLQSRNPRIDYTQAAVRGVRVGTGGMTAQQATSGCCFADDGTSQDEQPRKLPTAPQDGDDDGTSVDDQDQGTLM